MPDLTSDELLGRIRLHGRIPRHVAIIMDGNGRWARERVLPRTFGHRAGMKSVRDVVEGAIEVGVGVLSLFAFSQENWQRPKPEVSALMSLLEEYIQREADALDDNGRARARARRDGPPHARRRRRRPPRHGPDGRQFAARSQPVHLLRRACRIGAGRARAGRGRGRRPPVPRRRDEDAFAGRLYTAGMPDPDLLIRTSGELRISNFMLWQLAYTELYVSPVKWPDFRRGQFYEAIVAFQARDRRFGKVGV